LRQRYLFLPESLPDRLERWEWCAPGLGGGVDELAALPPAAQTWLVLPAARVTLFTLEVEWRTLRHLRTALAYALEERLIQEPDAVHVALSPPDADGRRVAAVVERTWLEAALVRCRAAGLQASGALPATLLRHCPERAVDSAWYVRWDGREGHVRTGLYLGYAFDDATADTPPQALALALEAARQAGRAPARLLVDAGARLPDLAAWSQRLGCSVQACNGVLDPADFNLLQGAYAPHGDWRQRLRPYRAAAALILAALGLHVAGVGAETAWLAWQRQKLEAEARERFRQAFPEARAIVDPFLQTRRQLETLAAARGQAAAGDLLPMLDALGGQVRLHGRLSYTPGRLQVQDAAITDAAALQAQLAAGPYRLERTAEGLTLTLKTP